MDFLFQGCAAVGGTVIALQFLLSLIGLGGEHGADGGADHGGGFDGAHVDSHGESHDGSHPEDSVSTWLFGVVTLRTVAAGLAFFGLTGMAARKAEVHIVGVLLMSTAAGLTAYYAVSWMMRVMRSLNADGTVNIHQAMDSEGKVYVAIPGGGQGVGKVLVEVAGRTLEYQAKTPGDALASGTPVRVVDILAPNTVEVISITGALPASPKISPELPNKPTSQAPGPQPGEPPPTSGDAITSIKPQQ